MLIRVRLLPTCQVVLMAGLTLAASQPMSAQAGNAPSPAPQVVSPQTPQAAPVLKLEDVVRMAQKEGRLTTITTYVATDFGLKNASYDSPPVLARVVAASNSHRTLYVVDETGALLFTVKEGDARVMYLANRAGVLQQAGRYNPGSFHSEKFQSIPKAKAATGFAAEKEFWIRKTAFPEYEDPAIPAQAVQKTDSAKSQADAKASEKEKKLADKKAKEADSDSTPPKKKASWF